jgi:hypothetical protein
MSREDESAERTTEEIDDDADPMRALLKRSLGGGGGDADAKAKADLAPAPPKDLLRGVQKRIRTRSRGKFYGDGWSTSSPRVSYMVVATGMLIILAIAYFALGPMGVSAH